MMAFALTANPTTSNLKEQLGTLSTSSTETTGGDTNGAATSTDEHGGGGTKSTSGAAEFLSSVLSTEHGEKATATATTSTTASNTAIRGDHLNSYFTSIANPKLSESLTTDMKQTNGKNNTRHQQQQPTATTTTQQGLLYNNQHHQQPSSIHSHTSTTSNISYPTELKRILQEVARSGTCAAIPWVAHPLAPYPSIAGTGRMQKSTQIYLQQQQQQSSKRKRQREYSMDSSRNSTSRGTTTKLVRTLINGDKRSTTSNTTTCTLEEQEGGLTKSDEASYKSSSTNILSSEILNKRNESMEKKLLKSNNSRDHGCAASSCSESISSRGGASVLSLPSSSAPPSPRFQPMQFRSLRNALRSAVGLVLDHSYKHQGGYKASAVEKKQLGSKQSLVTSQAQAQDSSSGKECTEGMAGLKNSSMDVAFMNRKKALLNMLGDGEGDVLSHYLAPNTINHSSTYFSSGNASDVTFENDDLAPGGTKGKKESSNCRPASINSNYSLDSGHTSDTSKESNVRPKESCIGTPKPIPRRGPCGPPFTIQRVAEILLKPDRYYKQTHKLCNALEKLLLVTSTSTAYGGHTGGDTSHNHKQEREMAAMADKRGRDESEHRHRRFKRRISSENSDPMLQMNVNIETPESRRGSGIGNSLNYGLASDAFSSTTPNPILDNQLISSDPDILGGKFISVDTRGTLGRSETVERNDSFPPDTIDRPTARRHDQDMSVHHTAAHLQQAAVDMALSPSLFPAGRGLNPLVDSHHQELQAHHAAAVLGASHDLAHSGQRVEIVIDPSAASSGNAVSGVQSFVGDLDGRSSASNSDIDSESDDVSFDDSASDRSDGSDSGTFEPFTAARVMALNRMQQQHQHRREQYLQNRALNQLSASASNFQPPSDSEYQSGDSIDSMMAEDSGGSDCDSSCSDL